MDEGDFAFVRSKRRGGGAKPGVASARVVIPDHPLLDLAGEEPPGRDEGLQTRKARRAATNRVTIEEQSDEAVVSRLEHALGVHLAVLERSPVIDALRGVIRAFLERQLDATKEEQREDTNVEGETDRSSPSLPNLVCYGLGSCAKGGAHPLIQLATLILLSRLLRRVHDELTRPAGDAALIKRD